VPAQPPGGEDLRAPPGRELRDSARLRPRLAREPFRELEEGERGVASVPHEVNPGRVREEPFEQRQLLHVQRRLVTPARLALPVGVRLEDRGDRLARRHPLVQARADVVRCDAPVIKRPQTPEVVEEGVDVGAAAVPVSQLGDEERLVGDRERRVPVEHHAQERRARAADAEDDHGGIHGRVSLEE
jgi:hypothetical protein